MLKRLSLLLLMLVTIVAVGCDSKPKVSKVTGKVTIKGSPAPENTRVNFEPVGGGELAAGMVDASGNYNLYFGNEGREGAMPGSYKVFLSPDASSEAYMSGTPSGVPGVPSAGPIPKEYLTGQTSPLTVEVPESDTTIDITIE
jgi:hypothetical protein